MTDRRRQVPLLLLREGPPVRRIPLALSRRFFQICTSAAAEALTGADLTPHEFAVMAYVNSIDGEPDLDQSALAARLGVDRNSTSLLVGSLESKGLLERRVSDADRRARGVEAVRAPADQRRQERHRLQYTTARTAEQPNFHQQQQQQQ